MTIIGRVAALENRPTTIDEFYFWTSRDRILNPFDVVVVEHLHSSKTYGVIEEIFHITDSSGYMGSFISNDFGDPELSPPTHRIGMNYIKAKVVGNSEEIYNPVCDGSIVRLATEEEVKKALGLSKVRNAFPCGYIQMYSYNQKEKLRIPVDFNGKFLIGPEGAHLNISGISGLAAKTSYSMFLLKGIQHKMMLPADKRPLKDETVAFVVINVKGRDLLSIDKPPAEGQLSEQDKELYEALGVNPAPFDLVKYYYPFDDDNYSNTYATTKDVQDQIIAGIGRRFKYVYEDDVDSIDLLLSSIDDSSGTMDSVCSFIQSGQGNFAPGTTRNWDSFETEVDSQCQKGGGGSNKEIMVQSWRKFKRIITKSLRNPLFANRVDATKGEVRLATALSQIKPNEVHVIDIAKLDETLQSYIFGDVIRCIYEKKLGKNSEENEELPTRIIIFIDELNKYGGSDLPKNSPILRQLIDITERGRSLGIVLFSAEQFKSAIHARVKGNCATHAYGRTNAIEISQKDYSYIPSVYKNMMIRMTQGEYIVQNPVFTSPLHIRFPRPVYFQEK